MSRSASATVAKSNIPTIEELGFDPQELRRKYDAERDKRLRADGNDQYREVVGEFEKYIEDPYLEDWRRRAGA